MEIQVTSKHIKNGKKKSYANAETIPVRIYICRALSVLWRTANSSWIWDSGNGVGRAGR